MYAHKGEVTELRNGSISQDYAYRIHTEIINKTVVAMVNKKIEPFDYQLKNGYIVEVVTSRHSYGPSQDWLKITQSSPAKNKIKQFFKQQRKEENIETGKTDVEAGIKELGFPVKDALTQENIERVCNRLNFPDEDDL